MAVEPSGEDKYLIAHCHVREEPLTDELKALRPQDSPFQDLDKVVLMEPTGDFGNGDNCICNSGTAPAVVTLLFLFSVCVQAAEGLPLSISGQGQRGHATLEGGLAFLYQTTDLANPYDHALGLNQTHCPILGRYPENQNGNLRWHLP